MPTVVPTRTPELSATGGVFSRKEALAVGETVDSLRQLCRSGAIMRLRRGYYVATDTYVRSTDVERHVLHARAELRAQDGEVALCGVSTAALTGLDLHAQDLSVVHLVRLDAGAAHRTRTVAHHRVTEPGSLPLTVVDGVRTVSVAHAVWEVACRSSLEGGVVTADSALRTRPAVRGEAAALVDRFANVPGSGRGRLALRLARDKSESAGESVTRVQCFRSGLPEPVLQQPFYDDHGHLFARTDFWWEEFRHVGEFDGKVKYGRLRRSDETVEDVVHREKLREDAVRAQGCGMSRFVWSSVMPDRARRSMAELREAMERSRRLYVTGVGLR